jgi:carbamoyltransferase
MKLLALRLCEHDSNISYFDGNKLHYHKSERTTQIKHHAFNNLWEWKKVIKGLWGVDYQDLDEIAIVVDSWLHHLPVDNETFFPAIEYDYVHADCPVYRINHHYAHALSTWMLADTPPTVSIVIDGYGDFDKSWSVFKNGQLVKEGSLKVNGSLGTEMADAARYLGVSAENSIDLAGKVMGLQSYGSIDYKFLEKLQQYNLYDVKGLFNLKNWEEHKGDALLAKLSPLDWIKTVHHRVGQALAEFFSEFCSPDDTISFSGGVAQNVIWNTELRKKFKNLIIPPHCSDEGLSLGSIEWLRQKNNLPKFTLDKFPYTQSDNSPVDTISTDAIKQVAELLYQGKVVAWYQEHGELGPRALGNRSILMNPTMSNGRARINHIKNRESYRPFGASILKSCTSKYFNLEFDNPYMLYVATPKTTAFSCITHIDNTCRVQTVNEDNGAFNLLLEEFYKLSGCPVLLNTSLNVGGRPIAGYIEDAKELFDSSSIDVLVVGNTIIQK